MSVLAEYGEGTGDLQSESRLPLRFLPFVLNATFADLVFLQPTSLSGTLERTRNQPRPI